MSSSEEACTQTGPLVLLVLPLSPTRKEHLQERHIASLSHDFGTPIAALRMALKILILLLKKHHLFAEAEPVLAGMEAALDIMEALKQKALDVAKLQQGEPLTPQRSPVDLRYLILTKLPALVRFMPKSEAVSVEYHVDDGIPKAVMTEGSWISMILVNFVSNAFKHTRQGFVNVNACLVEQNIRITVTDTGTGVPIDMEKNLWQVRLAGQAEGRRVLAYGRTSRVGGGEEGWWQG